ncbi:MAG: DUF222 domain-containing protein [Microbacteriaceae bacterium]
MTPTDLLHALRDAAAALGRVPTEIKHFDELSDDELLEATQIAARQRDSSELSLSLAAAVISRRSTTELGHSGLAQRLGHRTPHELVRVATRSTAREARSAIRMGSVLDSTPPWLTHVAACVRVGEISPSSAEAIANGIGEPGLDVDDVALASAAHILCDEARLLDADRLFVRAREMRADLDVALVADKERARRQSRSLRLYRQPDGMTRLTWLLDPESAAVAVDIFDRATSPRRGGPRFVDTSHSELASRIAADERTTEQLASDTFLELLRHGSHGDARLLLGSGAPSIRVVVGASARAARSGSAYIDGQSEPVSIATVERLTCEGATVAVTVDSAGQPLDVGREQRLYTRRQRIALAVRDSGCRWPGCDRPPSWCEAHHIRHWARDSGRTDTADGILLCRHHHLLAHNNGWEISRDGANYALIPPPEIDPAQRPVPMRPPRRVFGDEQREEGSDPRRSGVGVTPGYGRGPQP